MKIKISPSLVFSRSLNILINNNLGKKVLINTTYVGLPEGQNSFSIFIPDKEWILVRCRPEGIELEIGESVTVNN
jgi:hypothetical protein